MQQHGANFIKISFIVVEKIDFENIKKSPFSDNFSRITYIVNISGFNVKCVFQDLY